MLYILYLHAIYTISAKYAIYTIHTIYAIYMYNSGTLNCENLFSHCGHRAPTVFL